MAPTDRSDSVDILTQLHPRSLVRLGESFRRALGQHLWLQVLAGMLLGLLTGLAVGPSAGWVGSETASVVVEWLALPGQAFLALLQMLVVPLVIASVVRGLAASASIEQLRRMGPRLGLWLVFTTTVAVSLGLGAGLLVQPGKYVPRPAGVGELPVSDAAPPSLAELPSTLVTLLPNNPLMSMVEGQMLQVVAFSLIAGLALLSMQAAAARPVLELLGSVQEVCSTIMGFAMRIAPVAVFGLMARLTATTGLEALLGVGVYVVTVLGALLVLLVFYLVVVAVVGRRSPLAFLAAVREAQLLAFTASSAAAVLPISLEAAQGPLRVRPAVARLVLPLGATMNMDGTAVYQGVATVFLAQVYGIDLSTGALTVVVATAVGASLGSPSTPGAGIVLLAMVLEQVGIPGEGIALVIGVDRIVDMSRSALNCTGDLTACVVLDRLVGGPSHAEELAQEAAREVEREVRGQEVLTEQS